MQLSLPLETQLPEQANRSIAEETFSHNSVCDEAARIELEQRFAPLLEETDKFSRRIVSFQANKIEKLHSWVKYREGFSAQLVEILLADLNVRPGQTVLDPFAGSCTTLLEAKLNGVNAVGIELLPHCHLAWEAKRRAFDYDLNELDFVRRLIREAEPPQAQHPFPHLTITESAFPPESEQAIVAYALWWSTLDLSEAAQTLCRAALMSILEEVSYTRKDGQYLRWDARADKMAQRRNGRATEQAERRRGIDKGELPTVRQALLRKLDAIIRDVAELQRQPPPPSCQQLIQGSSLYVLPTLDANSFDAVITSPPYANRYDYTRTYALELAFLNVNDAIFRLRQNMLSCTVENKSKLHELSTIYTELGRDDNYKRIMQVIQSNAALNEVNAALRTRAVRGEINNNGVLRMIEHYFSELAFIFAELHRVCRPGAQVAFVNDNVRYAGEVIPVDLISSDLAQQLGFAPEKIYVLPQRKGNSSQQMGKFGRRELRKSITVWRKPQKLEASNILSTITRLRRADPVPCGSCRPSTRHLRPEWRR